MRDGPISNELRDKARVAEPLAFWLATWFGCGLAPYAPGTMGTLGALPVYLLLQPLGLGAVAAAMLVISMVGFWASERITRVTKHGDPQFIVIDETAGMLVTLLAAPPTWKGVLASFVLFRLFDTLKPFPCRTCEQKLPPGPGVMMDDICAGMWGVAVLLVARHFGWL